MVLITMAVWTRASIDQVPCCCQPQIQDPGQRRDPDDHQGSETREAPHADCCRFRTLVSFVVIDNSVS